MADQTASPRGNILGGRPARPLEAWSVRVSTLLIGSAFVLIITGNRWASYIKSPIPGLYLTDLLLLLGVIAAVPLWREVRHFRHWVWWTYGPVLAYLLVVLAPEILVVPSEDRFLALRDAAPFMYFALVPALAVILRCVDARVAIYTARIATALAALGTMLVYVGAVRPFTSPLLGSDFVQFFSYRSDLTGAALAIGMVAWGGWLAQAVRPSLLVQFTYVAVIAIVGVSRSGLVAVLVGVLVIAYRQRHVIRGLLVIGASILILVLGILYGGALSGNSDSPLPSTPPVSSPSSLQPESLPAPVEGPESSSVAWANRLAQAGTVGARLRTWDDVVTGLVGNGTWLMGGAAGSDYLYELCTGIPIAPQAISARGGVPKCAVDDRGPEPVVRDPHNWVLNIAITHGLLGVVVFTLAIGVTLWRGRRSEIYPLAGWTIGFFLVTGMTFLISAGYALLPMAAGAGWIVSRAGFRRQAGDVERDTSEVGSWADRPVS